MAKWNKRFIKLDYLTLDYLTRLDFTILHILVYEYIYNSPNHTTRIDTSLLTYLLNCSQRNIERIIEELKTYGLIHITKVDNIYTWVGSYWLENENFKKHLSIKEFKKIIKIKKNT